MPSTATSTTARAATRTNDCAISEVKQAGVLATESISHLSSLFLAIKRAAAEPENHAIEIRNLCEMGMYLADDYAQNIESHIEGTQRTMQASEVQS